MKGKNLKRYVKKSWRCRK